MPIGIFYRISRLHLKDSEVIQFKGVFVTGFY